MLRKLNRLNEMPWSERWSVVRASVLLPIVALSLRLAGFHKTYRWLEDYQPQDVKDRSATTGESVDIAARNLPLYRPTCLPRSLVLWHMLRRGGAPAELRIGVSTSGGQFAAHAWVEQDGIVINDATDIAERFAPVDLVAALGSDR